jgi:hypothetical protein
MSDSGITEASFDLFAVASILYLLHFQRLLPYTFLFVISISYLIAVENPYSITDEKITSKF